MGGSRSTHDDFPNFYRFCEEILGKEKIDFMKKRNRGEEECGSGIKDTQTSSEK